MGRVTASLRIELFPADLDASVGFYVSVLAFAIARDDKTSGGRYVWLRRDDVGLGLAERADVGVEPSTQLRWAATSRIRSGPRSSIVDTIRGYQRLRASAAKMTLASNGDNYWRITGR